jgi:hypothetical protein
LEVKERHKEVTSKCGVEVDESRKCTVDHIYRVDTPRILMNLFNTITIETVGQTNCESPMSFMNILTSEVFKLPSCAFGMVMSMDANICLVTKDTMSVYSGDTLLAADMIWVSRPKFRWQASLKSARNDEI